MPSFNPQQFDIDECKIVWASGETMDIRGIIGEFNYYEDIFANHISGNVVLGESLNLENKLSFNGNEYLILSLRKKDSESFFSKILSSDSGSDKPLNKIFRIYNMDDRANTKDSNEKYTINFCCEEFFISQQYKLCKAYKNQKISDIVMDIALNFLKIPEKEFPKEHCFETRGTYDIVIPNLMPLEAINWLTTFAISKDPNIIGATYLFYRDRFNWNFKPTLAIYGDYPKYNRRKDVYNKYYYSTKNDGSENDIVAGDLGGSDFNNILSYQILNNYDSFDAVQDGTFANKLISVNHLTRKHGVVEFKYGEYFDSLKKNVALYRDEQKYGLLNNFENRFKDTYDNTTDSYLKSAYSTTDLHKNSYIKSHQPDITNNYLEQTIPYRFAQMKLISATRVKILIPGDPYITVGDVVEIYLKSSAPVEIGAGKVDKKKDKFISGKYLVTAVRHRFNQESDFDTTLELCKDSFTVAVDSIDDAGLLPVNNDHPNYLKAKNNTEF